MPNLIAYLALALFPVVVATLYRRHQADRALIWSLLLGYLFLPEPPAVFDLPLMPPLTKHNIPALTAFLLVLTQYSSNEAWLPQSLVGKGLLATFVLSPVATVLNNSDPVFFGAVGLPGLGPKDAIALVLQQFLLVLPFLMARRHLASGRSFFELLYALMAGGLVYSLFMLIELRLSPQLNNWIYGYYQHLFGQSIRGGGYRPVVFLYHGLWVAFFIMTSAIAAFALWRYEAGQNRAKYLLAAVYLSVVLVLAKSLGALIFLVLLAPMVVFLPHRSHLPVAAMVGILALAYPMLKGAEQIPEDYILSQAASIDPQRAASLEFRFDNENTLLERAGLKPVFGWGSWGRNHILDPVSGNIQTVTDGRWIIVIGVYGWVGFIAEFGMLLWPVLLMWRETMARMNRTISPLVGPSSLLLAINILDMLPNATLTPLTWLVAGALTGYAEKLRSERLNLKRSPTALRWKPVL